MQKWGKKTWDAIVIGGGPAGATCATILAQHGRDVLLLEKARFPRHHIGESLMPSTYWTFQRLGVLEKLKNGGHVVKESVQFVNAEGKDSRPFFFPDRDPGEWSYTWQVKRDVFDQMMLDNAREKGATVVEAQARKVLFDGERAVGVQVRVPARLSPADERVAAGGSPADEARGTRDTQIFALQARVVVDASGQNALLSRQLDLRYPDERLRNAAIYSYYKGAHRDEGRNAGATLVVSTPTLDGWFWVIPLADDITSIGVVAPPQLLTMGRGDDPAATLEEEIENTPGIARRLKNATRVDKVYVCSDFSYRSRRIAGDGWVLIGDAFGFLDPVYSSGLMLAFKSGEWAADAIHDALSAGDVSGERLGRFGPRFAQGMQLLRQLVYAFYDQYFSFGEFMRGHPQYQDHLVRLLIGDVFNDEVGAIFEPMGRYTKLPEMMGLEIVGAGPESARSLPGASAPGSSRPLLVRP